MVIGVLHPGAMGSSLAAALTGRGVDTVWVRAGRSEATVRRAREAGMRPVASVAELTASCDTIVSVCPPAAATAVAAAVADAGFDGVYLDANAIAPGTVGHIAAVVEAAGATFVDGGIIGPPVRLRGPTVLYLSGPTVAVDRIHDTFADTALVTHGVGTDIGAASTVKMAFAAWTKGTSALLLAIRALAEQRGVVDGLEHAWATLTPELVDRLPATVAGTAPKAWRFAGEMEQIAATFAAAGLPDGFHRAAAEIYAALADLRDADDATLATVLDRLNPG